MEGNLRGKSGEKAKCKVKIILLGRFGTFKVQTINLESMKLNVFYIVYSSRFVRVLLIYIKTCE